MSNDSKQLGVLTTTDLSSTCGILLIPIGATEGHGPHLPLSTDTLIASAWANSMASQLSGAYVSDALPFGSSGEHQSFAGTLSIGQGALEAVLIELIRSAKHSFTSVALVSGHGGNVSALVRVVGSMRSEGHDACYLVPVLDGADAHAGHAETSIMLFLHPDLVRMEKAEIGCVAPLSEIMPELKTGGVSAVSPNGVLGDPTKASAAAGAAMFAELVAKGLAVIQRELVEG